MALTFKLISSKDPVIDALIEALQKQLGQKRRVLWLVPGGSAITVAVVVAQQLSEAKVDCSRLTISLTDERFGPVGHADSNWRQLLEAGFELPGANLHPVLSGVSMTKTASEWDRWLEAEITHCDYRLAFLGIGPDGHTAGILPGSLAVRSKKLVASFASPAFRRITITPPAIARFDEVIVYAQGEAKHATLKRLAETRTPLTEQPAQAIKRAAQATIYSDFNSTR